MIRRFLVAAAFLALGSGTSQATTVVLHLTGSTNVPGDPSAGTWVVTATLSDTNSLGLASFDLDVKGGPGITIMRAAVATATNGSPNPPFSQFRTNGTPTAPDLNDIRASQDTITAASNFDPSILHFGYGLPSTATSQTYGSIAPTTITLASGRWTNSGAGGTITAQLTSGAFFNLFPLNYAVDDGIGNFNPPPAGTTTSTMAATAVLSASWPPLPEPTSLLLMALGVVGFAAVRRHTA
jgi:hypothetical protein